MRFKSRKQLYWYSGFVAVLVVLHMFGILASCGRLVRGLVDPFVHNTYRTSQNFRFFGHTWGMKPISQSDLETLEHERDILKTRVALVESENTTLRRQLSYPDRNKWKIIGAEVIAKTSGSSEQALIINRGLGDGLVAGQVVFTDQGVLIGSVRLVEQTRSFIQLLNDPQSRIGALHVTNSHPIGIIAGGYGLGVQLTLIPPEEVVAVGDLIVSNDVTEQMPRGLLIGKITSVGRETYEPFQHALIEPTIPFDQVKTVTIIISK